MSGMHKITGKRIDGAEHIAQCVADILTTPLGSCVMRRDYGSRLFELIDTPLTDASPLMWIAATAGAIRKWEPRITLEKVSLSIAAAGRVVLTLIARRNDIPGNQPLTLSIPI